MASELANLVQLYIEGCENCCSVSIIDLERMRRGIEALETALAEEKAGRKLLADTTDKLRDTETALAAATKRAEDAERLFELAAHANCPPAQEEEQGQGKGEWETGDDCPEHTTCTICWQGYYQYRKAIGLEPTTTKEGHDD